MYVLRLQYHPLISTIESRTSASGPSPSQGSWTSPPGRTHWLYTARREASDRSARSSVSEVRVYRRSRRRRASIKPWRRRASETLEPKAAALGNHDEGITQENRDGGKTFSLHLRVSD